MAGVAISTSQIKSTAPLPPTNPFRVANAATIQLAANRARVFSELTPPPFVPQTYPPAPTAKLPPWSPPQPNLAPPGSFPGRVSRRAFDPAAEATFSPRRFEFAGLLFTRGMRGFRSTSDDRFQFALVPKTGQGFSARGSGCIGRRGDFARRAGLNTLPRRRRSSLSGALVSMRRSSFGYSGGS